MKRKQACLLLHNLCWATFRIFNCRLDNGVLTADDSAYIMKVCMFSAEPVAVVFKWLSTSEHTAAGATNAETVTHNGLTFL